jgi:hypothetical protein
MIIRDVMKKILICIIFSIMSFTAYTQYLTRNDINIFIKEYDGLIETYEQPSSDAENNKIWKNYYLNFSIAIDSLHPGYYFMATKEPNLIEKLFDTYKNTYLELMNYKNIPKELNDAFKNIGWKKNGNKKFITIIFGYHLLYTKHIIDLAFINPLIEEIEKELQDIEEREKTREEKMIIIKTNIDMYTKAKEFYDKLFNLINTRDRNIIKTHYNELDKVFSQ